MPDRLLIIDASNLVARCYHVVASGREGQSVIGLARHQLRRSARNLAEQVDPERICVALDSRERPTFRKELFPAYKAHRPPKPEEFSQLSAEAAEILADEIGAEVYEAPGYEADDVIATLTQAALPYGWRICVASSDRDLLALTCDLGGGAGVFALHGDKGAYHSLGPRETQAKLGVPPLRVAMLKALMGDSGDNYPGVPGIGEVAGRRLAGEYRTPEALYDHLDQLPKRDRARLEEAGIEHLRLMLTLATLRSDAPVTRQA